MNFYDSNAFFRDGLQCGARLASGRSGLAPARRAAGAAAGSAVDRRAAAVRSSHQRRPGLGANSPCQRTHSKYHQRGAQARRAHHPELQQRRDRGRGAHHRPALGHERGGGPACQRHHHPGDRKAGEPQRGDGAVFDQLAPARLHHGGVGRLAQSGARGRCQAANQCGRDQRQRAQGRGGRANRDANLSAQF